jgi:hypothetical protein
VLRYVAVLDGEWVALVGFGSAALSCAARDRFLGWSREAQYARLRHVVNNQRFCETFTDPARHTGACYAAANFVLLGETLGYARSAGR